MVRQSENLDSGILERVSGGNHKDTRREGHASGHSRRHHFETTSTEANLPKCDLPGRYPVKKIMSQAILNQLPTAAFSPESQIQTTPIDEQSRRSLILSADLE